LEKDSSKQEETNSKCEKIQMEQIKDLKMEKLRQ
jgi:hypothetical protein